MQIQLLLMLTFSILLGIILFQGLKKPDVFINSPPDLLRNLVPRFKIAKDSQKAVASPQTATYFGTRYSFPAQANISPLNNLTRPNICIVSGGGTLHVANFRSYCKLFNGSITASTFSTHGYNSLPLNGTSITSSSFAGATIENSLDAQIIGALCPNSNITMFIAPDGDVFGAIRAAATYLNGLSDSYLGARIISCSWGLCEYFLGPVFVQQNAALTTTWADNGITLVAASGDSGSADMDSYGIKDLSVDFPACLPYVIAVGGTTLNSSNLFESSWHYSGGGFSSYVKRPSYQLSVENKYPASINGSALTSNRSLPDISFNADPNGVAWAVNLSAFQTNNYMKSFFGSIPSNGIVRLGGTSCGSPAFAAFLGLLNKPKSYTKINKVAVKLYAAPADNFSDITIGNNIGNNDWNLNNLYSTAIGFDQCTGFGTIIGSKLTL